MTIEKKLGIGRLKAIIGRKIVREKGGWRECPHLDWGYDESGEAYCHDCKKVVPMDFVPRRAGGGRDSGDRPGEPTGRPGSAPGVGLTPAAAYPAACPFCGLVHHRGYFPKRTQVYAHGERIRALETELARYRESAPLRESVRENIKKWELEYITRAERAEALAAELESDLAWARRFILQSGFGALPDLEHETANPAACPKCGALCGRSEIGHEGPHMHFDGVRDIWHSWEEVGQERIRALEAGSNTQLAVTERVRKERETWKARAERAEAELHKMAEAWGYDHGGRLEAEARVAELIEHVRIRYNAEMDGWGPLVREEWIRRTEVLTPGASWHRHRGLSCGEAREREED